MGQVTSREYYRSHSHREWIAMLPATLIASAPITHTSPHPQLAPAPMPISVEDGEDDDSDSDSDQEFEDACDYLVDGQLESAEPTGATSQNASRQDSSPRRYLRRCNSILITTGMVLGMIFAYFQWRQQTWSNKMSALQACLAIEVSNRCHSDRYPFDLGLHSKCLIRQ